MSLARSTLANFRRCRPEPSEIMKLKIGVAALALTLAATTLPASATPTAMTPPAEYDIPYQGTLTIWRFADGSSPCLPKQFACTARIVGKPELGCFIYLPSDSALSNGGEPTLHKCCGMSLRIAMAGQRIIPKPSMSLGVPQPKCRNSTRRRDG
jgi:hypothetical protein